MLLRLLIRCLPALCAAPLHAQPADGVPRVGAPPWQTIELGVPGQRYPFPVYASRTLAPANLARIRHLVVIVHGIGRSADSYYETAAGLLWLDPDALDDTLVVAPRFAGPPDRGFEHVPAWSRGSWSAGGLSVKGRERPPAMGSFQVLDDLLLGLSDRLKIPGLQGIVLAGHSAGAQMVQRYAAFNNIDAKLRERGIGLRYVVANPSSYLYFSADRPRPDGGFGPYNRGLCPDFDDYGYGLRGVPEQLGDPNAGRLARRYARRSITYLLGGLDNNPEQRLLDKRCAAEAQGATRLARGRAYLRYEAWLATLVESRAHHKAYEVTGVAHDQRAMFGSVCGVQALLGPHAGIPPGAAGCVVPAARPAR